MNPKTIALVECLFLVGCGISGKEQQIGYKAVLVDVSPSMRLHRSEQLAAVRKVIETWEPLQTVDFIAVDGNPLGRPPLAHLASFLYDSRKSNPTRYRLESAALRKQYLAAVLPAIQQAIAVEDEKNERHPRLAETCLLDGLEVAARAARRVTSQSREILVLSDGYEDCRDSIHLPSERLNTARIDTAIREFERQGRLPHFAAPVSVYFIGTRRSAAYSRSYEDAVEQFWIELLTRCGAQVRTDNFTPTL